MLTCAMRTKIASKQSGLNFSSKTVLVKDYAHLNYSLFPDENRQTGDGENSEQVWCCAELTADTVYRPKNTEFTEGTSNFNSVIGWRIYAEHPDDLEIS